MAALGPELTVAMLLKIAADFPAGALMRDVLGLSVPWVVGSGIVCVATLGTPLADSVLEIVANLPGGALLCTLPFVAVARPPVVSSVPAPVPFVGPVVVTVGVTVVVLVALPVAVTVAVTVVVAVVMATLSVTAVVSLASRVVTSIVPCRCLPGR